MDKKLSKPNFVNYYMKSERRKAIKILNEFEEVLEKNNITIPDDDREGNPHESRLYGSRYYDLEDKIVNILKGPEIDANKHLYKFSEEKESFENFYIYHPYRNLKLRVEYKDHIREVKIIGIDSTLMLRVIAFTYCDIVHEFIDRLNLDIVHDKSSIMNDMRGELYDLNDKKIGDIRIYGFAHITIDDIYKHVSEDIYTIAPPSDNLIEMLDHPIVSIDILRHGESKIMDVRYTKDLFKVSDFI